MSNSDIDYGQLTKDWWHETGATIGASERAIKFSAAKFRGASNTVAAREAGYGGNNESGARTEGYRLYRSNKVTQLLALAAAEAGGGIDGTVQPAEAKQILSHLARGSDPSVRIKALEALSKMQEREDDAKRSEPEPTLEETLVAVIATLPMSGLGAAMAMGTWFDKAKSIATFPFLELCAPIVHQNFPTEWARFRNGVKRADMAEYLDKCADGMVIGGDDLVSAVRAAASSGTRHKPIKESASDAA
jgi:hypothetical protein